MKKKLKGAADLNDLMLIEQICYEMKNYLQIEPSKARLFAIGLMKQKIKEKKNEQ